MSCFIKDLGLDMFDFTNKFVCVTEENNSDANFCVGALMGHALRSPENGICLLALHHSLQHYHHIGMRIGYNLSNVSGKRFEAIESLDILDETNGLENLEGITKTVFSQIQSKLEKLRKTSNKIFIVIDDLSDFMNMGVTRKDLITFISYLRNYSSDTDTVLIGTHFNDGDEDQEYIKNFIALTSDLRIDVKNLNTGFDKGVTGSIELRKKDDNNVTLWSCPVLHQYKTGERTIKVFSPGNISFSYS